MSQRIRGGVRESSLVILKQADASALTTCFAGKPRKRGTGWHIAHGSASGYNIADGSRVFERHESESGNEHERELAGASGGSQTPARGWHIAEKGGWNIAHGRRGLEVSDSCASSDPGAAHSTQALQKQKSKEMITGGSTTAGARHASCAAITSWVLAAWFLYSCYELYRAFTPELCNVSLETSWTRDPERCILPLFAKDENVDIYLFASSSPSMNGMAGPFLDPAKDVPVWIASNIRHKFSKDSTCTMLHVAYTWLARGLPHKAETPHTHKTHTHTHPLSLSLTSLPLLSRDTTELTFQNVSVE
jgi:hypothetical protein